MRWRPDTCGCYLEFEGDLTPENVVFVDVCTTHTFFQTDAERALAVITENQNKNKVHGALYEAGLCEADKFEDWSFDNEYYHGARKLVISNVSDKLKANGAIALAIGLGAFEIK